MFELHAFLMIESISMEAVFKDDIISFANSAAAVVELITTPDFEANLDLCLQPFGVESSSNFETVTPFGSSGRGRADIKSYHSSRFWTNGRTPSYHSSRI